VFRVRRNELSIAYQSRSTDESGRAPSPRYDGYAPLRAYAVIGDGRTAALVADDGAIDWLALPNLDSPAVFASVLDSRAGGHFTLAPTIPYRVARRYLPDTNVLETTFLTDLGQARVIDALTVRGTGLGPLRELQRRVDGVAGRVPIRWQVSPRFGYGQGATRLEWRRHIPIATSGCDAVAVCAYDAGQVQIDGGTICSSFETQPDSRSLIALCAAHQEPLVFPTRAELDARFGRTVTTWREWVGARDVAGRWQEAVTRSALALKLLVHAPSGAVAAAATTSLPEQIGGERNWDYRFCWVRDAAFTLDSLLRLGCAPEAQAYFWWLVHASQLTRPRLQPLYRLDGGTRAAERSLPLSGYLNSRPVRTGNAAAGQRQLDTYGELLQTAWLYAQAGQPIDSAIGKRFADVADLVCRLWREPDAGIWEVRSAPAHFTHSKMMCWVALDRATRLADAGFLPRRHRAEWCAQAEQIREFVEQRCFSELKQSYSRSAGSDELDASVLLGLLAGYGEARSARWTDTVEAVRRELGHGPYLYRYIGEDGLTGGEGAFLSCSFWLAEALARVGRVADASALLDELVKLGNDVGLYAEEVDPTTGAFLGNLPQGLSHLSLISTATAIAEASK
jgi:GH15 family glucan-1,4-alpha-glucosidase